MESELKGSQKRKMWLIRWLRGLFKAKTKPPVFVTPLVLTIPYPEEPFDPFQTLQNMNIGVVLDRWMVNYKVPAEHRDFWRTKIDIKVIESLSVPAQTYDLNGVRHLEVKPGWLNAGVIAHEQSHNSYSLLTDWQKAMFSAQYGQLKTTDPLILLLYSRNTYGLSSDIEGHAELYRYLNEKMPLVLRKYYPKLIGG